MTPFFSFRGDEPAELAGRARVGLRTQVRKTRLELGIGECSIACFVQFIDNPRGGPPGSANPLPTRDLLARHGRAYSWNLDFVGSFAKSTAFEFI
jgi:hypothetical protein